MEPKFKPGTDLESDELKGGYKNFLEEIGIYFFILRMERGINITPVEKFLKITRGVLQQIEAGKFNWSTNMLEDIWDYYFSLPITRSIFSRFRVKNKKSVLADLIRIGIKRKKALQRKTGS